MKILKFINCLIICGILFSCNNVMKEVVSPDFQISIKNKLGAETTTFKTGDTIYFSFKGNPENLSFYSGEIGYRYKYEGSSVDTSTNVQFKFATAVNTAGSSGTMSLYISNNYSGYTGSRTLDSLNVDSATWVNISDRAKWATSTTTTSSGTISLQDYAAQGKPVSLAFRYDAAAALTQKKITLNQISLAHIARDTSYIIDSTLLLIPATNPAFATSGGWARVWKQNSAIQFIVYNGTTAASSAEYSSATTASFVITGNTTAATSVATQSWLVSGPINLQTVIPDTNIPLKDRTDNAETMAKGFYPTPTANYTYFYSKPGTYNIVFKAYNSTSDVQNYTLKQYTLTITQ